MRLMDQISSVSLNPKASTTSSILKVIGKNKLKIKVKLKEKSK